MRKAHKPSTGNGTFPSRDRGDPGLRWNYQKAMKEAEGNGSSDDGKGILWTAAGWVYMIVWLSILAWFVRAAVYIWSH